MRVVSTRVLPLPAPARISAEACGSVTAASCSGLRLARRGEVIGNRVRDYTGWRRYNPRTPRRLAPTRRLLRCRPTRTPTARAFRDHAGLRPVDPLGGAVHTRVPRQDLRDRLRRRGRRRRHVSRHHSRPQPAAQPRRPPRRRPRLAPPDRGHSRAAGHREPLRVRPAHHRHRDHGLRARSQRPGALAHRGAALARDRQFADGRGAHPRFLRQFHHGQAVGRARRHRHAADRRSPPRGYRRHPPAPGRRRHRADLAARLFAHRRDLQPGAGGGRDPGRGPALRAQARLSHGDRRRAQRPAPAPRPSCRRRTPTLSSRPPAASCRPMSSTTCRARSGPATTASSVPTSSAAISTARCCSSCSPATAWAR